ncbi:efflux RND transporter periplasmic adaptor subunit [Psychromonas hadalis]|uniref:efflux RND transporter periplasmic adaptor subunit n=1 Tax=Psychromonas hadalis TaxID=211669 RepID=UPI0003B42DB1|nr:efflux RND transporter periplasmic adaptor subunit [Psychromonas hadalis]
MREIAPVIHGFGIIKPKVQWSGVAQVKGDIVYKLATLARGEFIKQGTLLLRIDQTPYQLALATAVANKASVETEFEKLEIEKQKLHLSLELEKSKLFLEETEYQRQKSLAKKGTLSKSQLEKQQRAFIIQQLKIKELQSAIKLLPVQLNAIKATHSVAKSQIQQAQLDLNHTQIKMPFDGRIEQVNSEMGEYVSLGQVLFTTQDYSLLEVEAKIPVHQLRRLSATFKQGATLQKGEFPQLAALNLPASVTFQSAFVHATWQGTLKRISGQIDLRVGTVGVVIEIPFDFKAFIKGDSEQLPLISGMFVEINIEGAKAAQLVIPKKALHGGRLYLVDKESRLKIVPVETLFSRDGWVVIKAGYFSVGDQIVVSDLLPVATGLKLKTVEWESEQ